MGTCGRFFGATFLLLGFLWLCITFSLYVVNSDLYINPGLIEGRWLLCTLLFTGCGAFSVHMSRAAAVYIYASVLTLYATSGCIVSLAVYCANLHKIIGHHLTREQAQEGKGQLTNRVAEAERMNEKRFIQLAVGLLLIAFFGLCCCVALFCHLYDHGRRFSTTILNPRSLKKLLLLASGILTILGIFNLCLVGGLLTVHQHAFLQFYAVQDLSCSVTLLLLIVGCVALLVTFRGSTISKLVTQTVLAMQLCQVVMEIQSTWGAYYVALFMQHSLKGSYQLLVPLNFLCHLIRLFFVAYMASKIYVALQLPLSSALPQEISSGVYSLLKYGAVASLLLGIAHALLDVFYTSMHDIILRSLIAFSGASIFYSTLAGISLSVFHRQRLTIFLVTSQCLLFLWCVTAVHNIYAYFSITYGYILGHHDPEIHQRSYLLPGIMHFLEALASLAGLLVTITLLFVIGRLCHLNSKGGTLIQGTRWHQAGKAATVCILCTTLARMTITNSVQSEWNIFDVNLVHAGRDIIVDLTITGLLFYISTPTLHNLHLVPLLNPPWIIILTLMLVSVRALTTLANLDMETAYLQILIWYTSVTHGVGGKSGGSKSAAANLLTTSHVAALSANHALEVVHFIINLATIGICSMILEKTCLKFYNDQQPVQLLFTTEAAREGLVQYGIDNPVYEGSAPGTATASREAKLLDKDNRKACALTTDTTFSSYNDVLTVSIAQEDETEPTVPNARIVLKPTNSATVK